MGDKALCQLIGTVRLPGMPEIYKMNFWGEALANGPGGSKELSKKGWLLGMRSARLITLANGCDFSAFYRACQKWLKCKPILYIWQCMLGVAIHCQHG